MTRNGSGAFVGAGFGLVFILVNAGALPHPVGAVLRFLGVAAFVAALIALRRPAHMSTPGGSAGNGVGRGYWLVVAGEVTAGVVGLVLLSGPLDAPQAAVAWITLVVGVHFCGLAVVWKQSWFRWLGAAIALCGALGIALAAVGSSDAAIAAVAGVLPGVLLLVVSFRSSTSGTHSGAARAPSR